MENLVLTILSIAEVRDILRQELQNFHSKITIEANTDNEKPIQAKELCQFLNITEPTLIRWRNKGKIPFLKIGSRILYQKSAVVVALSSKQKGGPNGK